MRRWSGLCLLWGLLSIPPASAFGRSYWVHPTEGRPEAAGTVGQPVCSLGDLVGRLQPGDVVYLQAGVHAGSVTLTDRGAPEAPIVIRNAEDQAPVVQGATWQLQGASHLVIEGLIFEDCSPALLFGENASDNVVRRNRFINCPPIGRGNYERFLYGGGPNSHRNRVEDNVVERPYEPRGTEGPEAMNVAEGNRHWVIRGNRVSGYMYALQFGIGARGSPPGYHLVEGNEVFDCHEGFHIKTSDNIIRGNHIHDLQRVGFMMAGAGVFLRGGPRITVENNRIERAEGCGVRVMGSHHVIRNNLIVDTPVGVWFSNHNYGVAGQGIWLVHNTIVNATLPVWLSGGEAFLFNNILTGGPGAGRAVWTAADSIPNPIEQLKAAWHPAYAGTQDPAARFIADYNLCQGVELPEGYHPPWPDDHEMVRNAWWGAHNLEGDPRFVDPAQGDYRLQPDSPALGAGRQLPNAAYDLEDRPRPPKQIDLGAFQSSPDLRPRSELVHPSEVDAGPTCSRPQQESDLRTRRSVPVGVGALTLTRTRTRSGRRPSARGLRDIGERREYE